MEYVVLSLFGLLGIGMHIMWKWRDAYTLKASMDWKLHIINSGIAAVVVAILLLLKPDVELIFPNSLGLKVIYLMAGYQADSMWKNFTKRALTKMGVDDK